MNILVLAFLAYLAYRFIAGFLIPLFRTTRHMRQQFQDMAGGNQNGPAEKTPTDSPSATPNGHSTSGSSKVGEYIDFEEVK
jgi:hypothetical protein